MDHKPDVLIVDDRLENLLSVEAILRPLDITIFKASTAEAALSCMAGVEFAVILLDVERPEIDGFEAARLIRSSEQTQDVPIIFLTAIDGEAAALQKAYELGAVDFLVKPIQPDILRWKVSVFAELSRKARQRMELLHEQIAHAESEAAARRAGLIANASAALASSLDADVMIGHLIKVLVPEFADCAALYRFHPDRELRLDGLLHRESAACSAIPSVGGHVVKLTNDQDVLVSVFDGRLPLAVVNVAERPNSIRIDRTHAEFLSARVCSSVCFCR